MRRLFSIFLALISFHCFGQSDTINQTNSNGKKYGRWIFYYSSLEDAPIRSTGHFKNGRKEGAWKEYYSNGILRSAVTYKHGYKDSIYTVYYDNGNIAETGIINQIKTIYGEKIFTNVGSFKRFYRQQTSQLASERLYGDNGELIWRIDYSLNGLTRDTLRSEHSREILARGPDFGNTLNHFGLDTLINDCNCPDSLGTAFFYSLGDSSHPLSPWGVESNGKGDEYVGYFCKKFFWCGLRYVYGQDKLLIKIEGFRNGLNIGDIKF